MAQVELIGRVKVVASFGDGERNDAGACLRTQGDQPRQRWLKRHHGGDGFNPRVAVRLIRRDSFQHEGTLLRLQRSDGIGHVGPDVAAGQRPAPVARLVQFMQVNRLVGAVE